MSHNFLIFLSLIIFCNNKEDIIEIPHYGTRRPKNISTKNGPLTLQIYDDWDKYCLIDDIKNLNLFSFPNYNCTYKLYGKK